MNDFIETGSKITPRVLSSNENVDSNTKNNRKYTIYLINKALNENPKGIINRLILDNWGDYYYDYRVTDLNSLIAPLEFNSYGFSFILSSLNEDRYVKINLYKNPQEGMRNLLSPRDTNKRSLCTDTPYGFKLSQIMDNLLDIDQISLDGKPDGENFDGIMYPELTITQNINIDRDNSCNYAIFKFNILNPNVSGKTVLVARRILFKDILPLGTLFKEVLLNGRKCDKEFVNLDGRRLFVKLHIIKEGESVELSVVCLIDEFSGEALNTGALVYVFNNLFNAEENSLTTKVYTLLSNSLSLGDMI